MMNFAAFFRSLKKSRFKKEIIRKLVWNFSVYLILDGIFVYYICLLLPFLTSSGIVLVLSLFLVAILLELFLFYSTVRNYSDTILKTDEKFQKIEQTNLSLSAIDKKKPFAMVLNDYLEYFNSSMEREYSAKLLQKQAELDSMQSQINPHFLYNTLDSIRGQALEEGSVETAEMIESLSILFRYTIGQRGDILPLDQEFKNVDNYIKIQQYRFNNRFEVIKDIDENDSRILNCMLPKLTLQPIIENALYHGLDNVSSNGKITISAYTTQSRLIISVTDNGDGMDSEQLKALNQKLLDNIHFTTKDNSSTRGSGMALINVNARIKLLFGDKYGLIAYSTKNVGTKIEIVLPLMENNHEKGSTSPGILK